MPTAKRTNGGRGAGTRSAVTQSESGTITCLLKSRESTRGFLFHWLESLVKNKKTNKPRGKKKRKQPSFSVPRESRGGGGDFGFIAITALLENSLSTDGNHSASIYSKHEASFFLFPLSWSAKLLVTPSKLVLFTGVGLLGVCCFILLIILVLYLKEKVSY